MENDRVSDEKLLMARDNKKYRKVCRWMWYVSKDEKLYRDTSRKVNS